MRNMNFPKADNHGGVMNFWFIPIEDVVKMPRVVGNTYEGNLQLKVGGGWFKGYSTKWEMEWSQARRITKSGDRYEPKLSGKVPKMTPELETLLSWMAGRRFLILHKDINGLFKISGAPQNYLTFETDLGTGSKFPDYNGCKFSFSGESHKPAYYYSGDIQMGEGGDPIPTFPVESCAPVTIKWGNGNVITQAPSGSTFIINSEFKVEFLLIGPQA